VVVGEISGGEANAVVGETPNLAARLQAEAPLGGIVIRLRDQESERARPGDCHLNDPKRI
jgi:class 3 adenylate cyclase